MKIDSRRGLSIDYAVGSFTLLISWLAVTGIAWAEAPVLTPQDFSIGRVLASEREGLLQSVELDYDVYRRSVEPGLADLRVFEESGRPVPYAIRRRVPATRQAPPEPREVPLFELGLGSAPVGRDGAIDVGDYRIDAEISATGAIVSVHRGDAREDEEGDQARGWLLDTSRLDRSIIGLELTLSASGGDFVSRIRVEASEDLSDFREVASNLALVRLIQEGHRIERTEFEIPRTRARYLLMTPMDAFPPAELIRVRVRLAPDKPSRARVRHVVPGRFDSNQPGVVLFDLETTSLPIESVRVLLSEPNTIIDGRLESAASEDGPWRLRQSGLFYFFEKGGALRNASVRWHSPTQEQLRLVTSTRGGGLVAKAPSLEVVWQPEQLIYLQRSAGNSLLAIGRAGAADGSFAPSDLMRMTPSGNPLSADTSASLGPESVLAGDAALELEKPVPWRSYALWSLLLLSVGIILALSLHLMRSTNP